MKLPRLNTWAIAAIGLGVFLVYQNRLGMKGTPSVLDGSTKTGVPVYRQ